jgi:leader peptidase (prepilin peptidase) / N-methyltransferase
MSAARPSCERRPSRATETTTVRLIVGSLPARSQLGAAAAFTAAATFGVATSLLAAPGLGGLAGAGLALVMLAIAAVDARYFIIPDELSAAGLAVAFGSAVASGDLAVVTVGLAIVRGAALALIFLGIRLAYHRLRGREGMGLGDVKLAAVGGAWLDWPAMPVAVEIASISALAICLASHAVSRRAIRRTSRLPFGLFFALAIWVAWLVQTLWLPPL